MKNRYLTSSLYISIFFGFLLCLGGNRGVAQDRGQTFESIEPATVRIWRGGNTILETELDSIGQFHIDIPFNDPMLCIGELRFRYQRVFFTLNSGRYQIIIKGEGPSQERLFLITQATVAGLELKIVFSQKVLIRTQGCTQKPISHLGSYTGRSLYAYDSFTDYVFLQTGIGIVKKY